MGHLINPVSVRLCVNRVWSSNWVNFSKNTYSYLFINDLSLNLVLKFLLQDGLYSTLGLLFSHFIIINNLKGLFICIYLYDSNLESMIRLDFFNNLYIKDKNLFWSVNLRYLFKFYLKLNFFSKNYKLLSSIDKNFFYKKYSKRLCQKVFESRKCGYGSNLNKKIFYYIQLSCYYFLFKSSNTYLNKYNKRNLNIKFKFNKYNLNLKSNIKLLNNKNEYKFLVNTNINTKYKSKTNSLENFNFIRLFYSEVFSYNFRKEINFKSKKKVKYTFNKIINNCINKRNFVDSFFWYKSNIYNKKGLAKYWFLNNKLNNIFKYKNYDYWTCIYIFQKIFIECIYFSLLKKLKKLLLAKLIKLNYNFIINDIYFILIDIRNITASLVANFIVQRLYQKYSINEVLNITKQRLVKTRGLKGFRIKCSGRFSRKQRASIMVTNSTIRLLNRLPLSNSISKIDYAFNEVTLKYGRCGVKVWLFFSNEKGLVPYSSFQIENQSKLNNKIDKVFFKVKKHILII